MTFVKFLAACLLFHSLFSENAIAGPVLRQEKISSSSTITPLPDQFGKTEMEPGLSANFVASRQSSQMGVSISAGRDHSSSRAHTYGREVHVISGTEISSFRLGDHSLKQAVKSLKGRAPNDAFLKSPTPWGDLYKKYNWQQVTTTLVPISTQILGITTQPTIVKSVVFENKSSQKGTFDVSITESVRNTVTSTWDRSGSVSVGQTFKYNVEFLGTGGGGETSFNFEAGWGVGGSKSTMVTLGSTSGVNVELDPGESIRATLRASRGTMKVKVTYRASLSGYVANNYNPRFQGHHFWAYGINSVLAAGGLPRSMIVTQTLDVGYYSDSSVVLSDHHH